MFEGYDDDKNIQFEYFLSIECSIVIPAALELQIKEKEEKKN